MRETFRTLQLSSLQRSMRTYRLDAWISRSVHHCTIKVRIKHGLLHRPGAHTSIRL